MFKWQKSMLISMHVGTQYVLPKSHVVQISRAIPRLMFLAGKGRRTYIHPSAALLIENKVITAPTLHLDESPRAFQHLCLSVSVSDIPWPRAVDVIEIERP